MASPIVVSVHSALDDLALLQDLCPDDMLQSRFVILRHRLRNLITFLLCVRKLGNDVHLRSDVNNNDSKDRSLGSLLGRIKDAVCRNAEKVHTYREDGFRMDVADEVDNFQCEIESFEKEIDEWYIYLSGDHLRPSSSPSSLVEIIDSVLDNLVEFLIMPIRDDMLVSQIEHLGEKIKLLKSFVRFASLLAVEHQQLEDLLAHIEAVAVDAAHLAAHHTLTFSYLFNMVSGDKWWEGMHDEISVLLQRIKPIDSRVSETYTKVLTSLKLSRKSQAPDLVMDDDPIGIVKDFVDFLACSLWEVLQLDAFLLPSVNDRLLVLYEELRFLRIILKEQPNKFGEKIMDLTVVAACDAGAIIFSLYQKDVEIYLALVDLIGRVKVLRAEIAEKVEEASTFNFPRTNELGSIDLLMENMMELTSSEVDPDVWNQIRKIHEEFAFFRSLMGEIAELRYEQEELQTIWNRVMEVAYKVESLIDHLLLGGIQDSFSTSFDSIREDISNVKTDALKVFHSKGQDLNVKKVNKRSDQAPSQYSAPVADEIVGFDGEAASIVNRLTRGSKKLRIFTIVGMAGLGKTTLATKIYNDRLVMRHFHIRAWCTVSHMFDQKKVLLELLNHIVPNKYFDMTEQDLAEELRRRLKGRRYLIFLDDIWDIEVWNSLGISFPDDSYGNRIILTSRLRDTAPQSMLHEEPYFLRQLNADESWDLLQRKLFHEKGCPSELCEMGMEIAENCKGLPLTIVIVAGLLANTEPDGWKKVLESLSSGAISSVEQCMNTLELSYQNLPDYLKPCFLYFGAFPEDLVVSVRSLIWFWVAEGFVRKTESKSSEDVAKDYMMDLIGRSLLMVARRRSMGGVKACRIHDLLHDFCLTKAKEEKFFLLLRGYDELSAFHESGNQRRLCIYSTWKHFKESRLFCPRLRSLLFFDKTEWYEKLGTSLDISFIIHSFKLLRVLNIREVNLGQVFPNAIELLVLLRYLAVQGEMEVIPPSIGNLKNLETFFVDSRGKKVSLPHTFWNLQKLRHLYIRTDFFKFVGFSLPSENLCNSFNLYELDSCSGVIISSWRSMENQLRKFPNIRRLKCRVFEYYDDDTMKCGKIIVPESLSRLESLNVSPVDVDRNHTELEFGFPVNLKKLTLSGFQMPWSKILTIGQLPNLEVLKLLDGCFSGEAWDMEEGTFLKLRFLKLTALGIVRWTASDDQLPNLQKLVLQSCPNLEEIPSCLEYIPTLEMIEVYSCSDSIASSVKQIQKVQMELGNSVLSFLISHVISKSS